MSRSRFFKHVHGLFVKAEQEGSVTLNKEQLQQFASAVIAELSNNVLEEIEQEIVSELREARDVVVKEFDGA